VSDLELMRWPSNKDKDRPSGPSVNSAWLKFVCDDHLEWLMSMLDCLKRGEELDREDAECYVIIQAQAGRFMARADAEGWSEEESRMRVADAWKVTHATP